MASRRPACWRVKSLRAVATALTCAALAQLSFPATAQPTPVPLCMMLPLTSALDSPWPYAAAETARGLFLAVDHINAADCRVLGEGCEQLLDMGGGRRLQISPYVEGFDYLSPQGAAKAVRACLETDAEVLVGTFTSEPSSQVVSFISGLGRFLWSTNAVSPALSRRDLYPNFARSSANHAELSISLAHYIKSMGWSRVVIVHRQDLFGAQQAEVFTQTATGLELEVDTISLGTQTEEDFQRAAGQLINTGTKIVVMFAWAETVLEGLRTVKHAMDDEGVDYHSYTWINGGGSIQPIVDMAQRGGDPEILKLIEGLQGADFSFPITTDPKIVGLFLAVPSQELAARTLSAMNTSTPGFGVAAGMVFNQSSTVLGALGTLFAFQMYDTVWSAAVGLAAAARAMMDAPGAIPTGTDVAGVFEKGLFPVFEGTIGPRGYLANGDWDLNHTNIEIGNYGTPRGASEARLAIVATIDLGTYQLTIAEDEVIVWANGRQYPYVPSDHAESRTWLVPVLAACGVVVVLLCALSACLFARNKYLKRHVTALLSQAKAGLDLDSPMAKTLEFLRRYQQGILRRPSAADAARLEALLVSHSGALEVPDLEAGLSLCAVDAGIRNFLLTNMQRGGGRRSSSLRTDSVSTLDISAASRTASLPGVAEASDGEDDCAGVGERPARPPIAVQSRSQRLMRLTVQVQEQIGADFFLDLVTPRSYFFEHPEPLSVVVEQGVESLRLLTSSAAKERLMQFTAGVEEGYLAGKYHCKHHGADVTNRLLAILSHSNLIDLQLTPGKAHSPQVGLLGMVAAMVHDYGHPQVNNQYQIDQETEMAYDFNDQAVAEHYALRETMKLLRDDNLAFLSSKPTPSSSKSTASKRKRFRSSVIKMVLSTDMSQHFDLLNKFETKVQRNKELVQRGIPAMWNTMNDEQRMLVLQMALKVADIGHCALPMQIHVEWVKRLEDEFFAQGDLERAAGISPISALMDRDLPGASAPQNQVGFFKVIVLPLFNAWVEVFPACAPLLEQVEANLAHYEIEVSRSVSGTNKSSRNLGPVASTSTNVSTQQDEAQPLTTKRDE